MKKSPAVVPTMASTPASVELQLPVTIGSCKVSSGEYMRCLCAMLLADNWLWLLLPLVVCGMLAVMVDVRWGIVGLMVLFIVIPMVLVLLYFHYGFSPLACWSLMDKSVTIDREEMTLQFEDQRMNRHAIPWRDVSEIVRRGGGVLFMMRSGRYSFLMLPAGMVDADMAAVLRQVMEQQG